MPVDAESKKNLQARIAKNANKLNNANTSSSERKRAAAQFQFDKKMLRRLTANQTTDSNNE
jgi:hypothetical protein